MGNVQKQKSVVYTNKAKCRDCYRCIRACPVNAIKIESDQASVIPERCIACGTCIRECPQEAKAYASAYEAVMQMLENDLQPAVSLAPSFVSLFESWEIKRLASALRQAGFGFITETSVAAYHVSQKTSDYIQRKDDNVFISSACPAVVNYIEKYFPRLIPSLVPVLSPAMAHGRMLKKKLGREVPVVFAGPCVAKKEEAEWPENKKHVDAVLTFSELLRILEAKSISLKSCEESEFDEKVPGHARLYPLEGGLLKTAGMSTDLLSENIITVSGSQELEALLSDLSPANGKTIIEPLFCKGGCINGPDMPGDQSCHASRTKVFDYYQSEKIEADTPDTQYPINTSFQYKNPGYQNSFSEDEIRSVLAETGKAARENQLNCGACGYNSCREKAIAVLQGLAEPEMCIPFMRRLAEQKSDTLFRTDPNGIIILDEKLRIKSMNPAFKKMFSCSDAIIDKPVSYLIDPEPFEKLLLDDRKPVHKIARYSNYNLVCHQIHYAISEENQYVGIFVDITEAQSNEKKLRDLQSNAILQAQELLEHQTEMARKMTRFLGENTAKGEMLMRDLIDALDKENGS